jgi:two-component system, OmpR family, catabolic regulation response regulator CreB
VKKILIIEDEPSIADNIIYALKTEGFDPLHAGTGSDALALLRMENISLAILDIGLPDINGFDLLKEIRAFSSLRVIILTARADEVDRIVGLEIGADDYVTKPFSPRELTARVKAVLRRGAEKKSSSVDAMCRSEAAYPFSLDDTKYTIKYHGELLDLSRYEFRLLRTLVLNPGRVYTREQLMERISEDPDMSLDRTIDTHIKTIRQKLKNIRPGEDPITTHRGLGYSLKELS